MGTTDQIRSYLARTHAYAWFLKDDPAEPDLVHAILAEEMWPILQLILRAQTATDTDVVVRGIFTHQTPYVKEAGKTNGCELADLMLVRIHKPLGNPPTGKALLIQAKKTTAPKTGSLSGAGDAEQFSLYSQWNPFLGTSRLKANPPPPAQPNENWTFRGPALASDWESTSQYATVLAGHTFKIDDKFDPATAPLMDGPDKSLKLAWPNQSPWSNGSVREIATADNGVDCPHDFSQTLREFVEGGVGREFDPATPQGSDHWSIFVQEMLTIATEKNYRYRKIQPRTQKAHVSAFSTVLGLVAEQQVVDYINGDLNQRGFDFINESLDHIRRGGAPRQPPAEDSPGPPRGHVPIPLIVTYGEALRFKD